MKTDLMFSVKHQHEQLPWIYHYRSKQWCYISQWRLKIQHSFEVKRAIRKCDITVYRTLPSNNIQLYNLNNFINNHSVIKINNWICLTTSKASLATCTLEYAANGRGKTSVWKIESVSMFRGTLLSEEISWSDYTCALGIIMKQTTINLYLVQHTSAR